MTDVDVDGVRLTIDYGTVATKAILTWPDGQWTVLQFDGLTLLSSAVALGGDGGLRTGAQAWREAGLHPQRLLASPKRHVRDGTVDVDGRSVDVLDLVAATLRRVGQEAARLAGRPVAELRLVVPPGWGPRRRTAMRTACHRAGLPPPDLIEAPVAVAQHLLATGATIPLGAPVLICDHGADLEATLLGRTGVGFDVLATLSDPDAGGDRLDRDLAGQLAAWTGHPPDAPGDSGAHLPPSDPLLVANARTAKEALASHPSIAVPVPGHAPILLSAGQLHQLAAPVQTQGAATARATLEAVEGVQAQRLAGVYLVGGGAHLPGADGPVGEQLGRPAHVVTDPQFAAVRGAAAIGASESGLSPTPEDTLRPLLRTLALLVAGFGSLVLVAHAYLSARLERQPGLYDPHAYVRANWGELALASVFALITCMAAATLVAANLPPSSGPARTVGVGGQVGTALLIAVAISLCIGGVYGVAGSVYFGLPVDPFLRWTLLPQVPIAAAAIVAAAVSTRLRRPPPNGWDAWLAFPVSSLVAAAAGTILIQVSLSAPRYPWDETLMNLAGRGGGLLLGIGAALVATRPIYRVIVAAPLAVFAAAIVSWPTSGILAFVYVAAVTMWWVQCLWRLVRAPAGYPSSADLLRHPGDVPTGTAAAPSDTRFLRTP
jgi:hypothetical protein